MTSDGDRLAGLLEQLQARDRALPPVQDWQPQREGTIDIRIDRAGRWFHEGEPFQREALVRLFSTLLRREGDRFFLVTPVEKLAITVEDCPFVAESLQVLEDHRGPLLLFTTNVGDQVLADAEHPLQVTDSEQGTPHPVLHVRHGLEALVHRSVFYQLVDLADAHPDGEDTVLTVTSAGVRFELGRYRSTS